MGFYMFGMRIPGANTHTLSFLESACATLNSATASLLLLLAARLVGDTQHRNGCDSRRLLSATWLVLSETLLVKQLDPPKPAEKLQHCRL